MENLKNSWACQHKTELIILSIVVLFCSASLYMQMKGLYLDFIDTDDYMRVVRIREFFQNHDLYNNVIERCNVPYGCSLHWTRFYDFFIIIPSYLLSFFTTSINTAIDYVCFCISPIIRIATAFVFLKMLHDNDIMNRDNAFLCVVLFAAQPLIIAYGNFGRPDHHAFIVLFMVLFLAQYLRAAQSSFKKHYISTARLTALCIWISPETLIPLLLADGIAFLYGLKNFGKDEKSRNIYQFVFAKNLEILKCIEILLIFSCLGRPAGRTLLKSGGIIATMELMRYFFVFSRKTKNKILQFSWILLFLVSSFILRELLPIYYDEISVVHWGLYASATYFFWPLPRKIDDKVVPFDVFCAAAGVSTFLFMFPKFLLGMGADVSPYVKQIWLSKVNEMQSPFNSGDTFLYILHASFVVAAVCSKFYDLFKKRYTNDLSKTFFWLFFSGLSAIYIIFAGLANRMLLYSSLFSLSLVVDLCMNNTYFSGLKRGIRIFSAAFMTIFFMIFAAAISGDDVEEKENIAEKTEKTSASEDKEKEKEYSTRELLTELDHISPVPVVIMAHSNDGPSILYYTKHCTIGAPYHRQQEGIISSYEVMQAPYDEEKVKKIVKETGTSYIFIKVPKVDQKKGKKDNKVASLPQLILEKKIPEWLEKVRMSEKFEEEAIVVKVKI